LAKRAFDFDIPTKILTALTKYKDKFISYYEARRSSEATAILVKEKF